MIEDAVVVDATVHGYNLAPSNLNVPDEALKGQLGYVYDFYHKSLSLDDPRWLLAQDQFLRRCDPEMFAWCLFGESQTDLACYHAPGLFGFFEDGGSPIEVGLQAGEMVPNRMLFYGSFQPFDPSAAIEEIDRQVEEYDILGLKFYPNDLWQGKLASFRLDDEEIAFPIFEHARKRGVRTVAIHKAAVFGPMPINDYRITDIEGAALAFPDMTFEIVHGGYAFVEDTAFLLGCFPNVVVNIESTSSFLNWAPERFAHMIGSFLQARGEDRIVWATGAMGTHPRPLVERFWDFEIPDEIAEGYGYPQLSKDIKRKILGENFARLHGLDLDELVSRIPDDEFRRTQRSGMAEPWSHAPPATEEVTA